MAIAVAGLLVLPGTALAGFFTPKSGAPPANQIGSLYKIILYIAAVVFVRRGGLAGVFGVPVPRQEDRVAAQIHGNTQLEVGWTVGAAVVLVMLTVVTFVKLGSIVNPPNSSAPFLSASLTQPTPPNGKELTSASRAAVHLALRLRQRMPENPFASKLPYSYQEMYCPPAATVVLSDHSPAT